MRFIVYGAGGIGSIIGGHLYRTGHDVVLVGNQQHVDEIREAGLRLLTPDETYILRVPACKTAEALAPFSGDDVVILTAKSQHTATCLGQLKNAGAPRTLPIFCAQNSITNEPAATRIFDNIYGIMLNMPAIFLHPGEVIHPITGNGGFIEVGRYPSGADELTHRVADALQEAGFVCRVNDHVMRVKAAKTLINLNNALEAITDARGDADAYNRAARAEAETVWRRAGIEWEDFHEYEKRSKTIRGTNKMPKGYEGDTKRSSTWQSLTRGTGNIEAEAINGDIVKLGRALGIPTPYNETLWRVAEDMARKGEKPGRYTIEELKKMTNSR
ncbi:MAG: ketopantoate reductase family protein [Candidatus Bathyarchaeota archaeon]|nr:ketopantoate reductase family protein [Candidatus Bathyarchaeota archaeon]